MTAPTVISYTLFGPTVGTTAGVEVGDDGSVVGVLGGRRVGATLEAARSAEVLERVTLALEDTPFPAGPPIKPDAALAEVRVSAAGRDPVAVTLSLPVSTHEAGWNELTLLLGSLLHQISKRTAGGPDILGPCLDPSP